MNNPTQELKRKIILSFSIIIILILCSGALGWELTRNIEAVDRTNETAHLFKIAELQLRREEKNLLIRGYSVERFHRWQRAKEEFYHKLGELTGLDSFNDKEADELRSSNSAMSEVYREFFEDVKSGQMTESKSARYDVEFKAIGQRSMHIIDAAIERGDGISKRMDSQANLLIIVFSIVFIGAASFLVINVLRSL